MRGYVRYNVVYFFLYLLIWLDAGFARLIHHHQNVLERQERFRGTSALDRHLSKNQIKHKSNDVDIQEKQRFAEQKIFVADDMAIAALALQVAIVIVNIINFMQNRWYAHQKTYRNEDVDARVSFTTKTSSGVSSSTVQFRLGRTVEFEGTENVFSFESR